MTKILILNYEYPPLGGGAATQTRYLAQGLALRGHEVTVLTAKTRRKVSEDESVKNLKVIRVPSYRGGKKYSAILGMVTFSIFAFVRLFSLMRALRPEICVCFFGIPCGPIALWIKLIYKTPYILCLRGGDVPGANPSLERIHSRIQLINKTVWRNACYVTVNSQKLARQARRFYDEIDYRVIFNGIDTECFRPLSVERQKAFLYVGRLDHDKNVEWLFGQIMPNLLQRHPEFTFTIIGEGPLKSKLVMDCQQSSVMRNVKFLGWIDREALTRFYNDHAFLIHPSISEGMSNVLLEAKVCGMRCIGLDVPENRELLEPGIDLISTEPTFLTDVGSFIDSTPPQHNTSGLIEQFSIDVLVKNYENIISDCSDLPTGSAQS